MALMDPKKKPYSDEARWIAIYPAYINSKKTVAEGRQITKDKAIDNPTSQEVFDVLTHLGLNCKLERNKMHPRDPNRDSALQGRVRVQLHNDDGSLFDERFPSRKALMLQACDLIPKLKTRAPTAGGSAPSSAPSAAGGGGGGKQGKKKRR